MNKRSEPLFQKSNFSLPGSDKFLNFFITPPKTFQLSLGVAWKENSDFVGFVTSLSIFAAKRPDYISVVTFYSDSLDVLWWVRSYGKDFRAFVANRVGEIQMFSDPQQWQHVPRTEQNPADLISHDVNAEDLKDNSLWWNGPQWLLEDEDSRPRVAVDDSATTLKETRKPTVLVSHRNSIPKFPATDETIEERRLNPHRYSSWMHLVAIHARVLRVLCNMRKKENRVHEEALHAEEIGMQKKTSFAEYKSRHFLKSIKH